MNTLLEINLQGFSLTGLAAIFGVAGTIIGAFLKFLLDRRKNDSSDFKYIIENYDKELKRSRSEIARFSTQIKSLQRRLDIFESSKFNVPCAYWIKDKKGRLVYANRYYIDDFLTPNNIRYEDAIDKKDVEIWPSRVLAESYRQNDIRVMRNGERMKFDGQMQINGDLVNYRALIAPYLINGEVAGVVGLAIPLD